MGFISMLPIIGKLFDRSFDLADQAITDKDKLNDLKATLSELREKMQAEIYLAELATQTVPWIDAIHKMGRQILNLVSIGSVVYLLSNDIEITGPAALILGGGNAIYQFVKGRGKE
jgi:hypothetical protein